MNKVLLSISLLIIIAFSGCLQTSRAILTNENTYPRLNYYAPVTAYLNEENVANFEEIGIIEINKPDSLVVYLYDVLEEAKSEARLIGANCIIRINDFLDEGYRKRDHNRYFFRAGYVRK